MKHIIHYSFFFLVIFFTATSCKKPTDQIKYIPKDAGFVFDLNWKSLSEKASKANINWDSILRSTEEPDSSIAKAKRRFPGAPLKDRIVQALKAAGKSGATVKDIAKKLGKSYGNISVWFHTTGKGIKEIKKVAPGKFAWAS